MTALLLPVVLVPVLCVAYTGVGRVEPVGMVADVTGRVPWFEAAI